MTTPADTYSVAQLMADARATYARSGSGEAGLRALGTLLQRLARTPDMLSEQKLEALHGGEAAATVLHSDGAEGLTLMLARFTTPTSLHDHGSWGVGCVVQGRDRYQTWERLDDASDPARGDVRMVSERDLAPGDVVTWGGPPHDLHVQQGVDGPAWELILFGRNITLFPRHYFDPATGAVRTVPPR